MTSNPEPCMRLEVEVTNPGPFFACCGLLELVLLPDGLEEH